MASATDKDSPLKEANNCGLVLFNLDEQQTFAIGTLKVKELLPLRRYRPMPAVNPAVLGVANIRGATMPIIDMAASVGFTPIEDENRENSYVIVTDCLRMEVGFLVRRIDRIYETSWHDIRPPAPGLGRNVFITGVTEHANRMIQIINVELIISEIFSIEEQVIDESFSADESSRLTQVKVLIVDDSAVARRQLAKMLESFSIPFLVATNGVDALSMLRAHHARGEPFNLVVSDIEMPGLNGYELTFEIKNDPSLADLYIILHTSLSSAISVSQARQVGANEALTKFNGNKLIRALSHGAERYFAKINQVVLD
jgi:two-component system chemotaxis response regulator CheV